MAGLGVFASHEGRLYLGAGWPQWRPLNTPSTNLPFSEAAGWKFSRMENWTKLTATSLAVSAGPQSKCRLTRNAVASSQSGLSSLFLSSFHRGCVGFEQFLSSCFSTPQPHLQSLFPLIHMCDRCIEWGLIAGLWGFASHRERILSRGWLGPQWRLLDTSTFQYARQLVKRGLSKEIVITTYLEGINKQSPGSIRTL